MANSFETIRYSALTDQTSVADLRNEAVNFWTKFAPVIGLPVESPVVRSVTCYGNDVNLLDWIKKQLELPPFISGRPSGTFRPALRTIALNQSEWINLTLAHEIGHSAVKHICGFDLTRPVGMVNEGVADMADNLYRIWNKDQSIDSVREKCHEDSPEGKANSRNILARYAQDNWRNEGKATWFGDISLYLLQTHGKAPFHKFLRSTKLWSSSNTVKDQLAKVYGIPVQQICNQAGEWWYGE